MNTTFFGFAVLLFLGTVLAVEGLYLYWSSRHGPRAKRFAARIELGSADAQAKVQPLSILKQRMLSDSPLIVRLLSDIPFVHSIDSKLRQAGSKMTVGRFIGYTCAAAVAGLAIGSALALSFVAQLAIAGMLAVLPWLKVCRDRSQRLRQIERQLPDAADSIARALRAGHSFASALAMLSEELAAPLGAEFRIAFDEINFGVSMNTALYNMTERVPLDDLRYFVIAVLIQRESGGNLAEILSNIGFIIRERLKLFAKVRALSAEGRLSGWVLALLPFVVIGVLSILSPGFIKIFWTDPAAEKLAGLCLGLMTLGILWMRKIVRIRV
ncbi:MAG TPA: type II secretion system F family protein [Trinickia sp.]|uniref:type II secretion system F family protein n=1 Tax=Trinickia sp. TaxID=2571163 RepID=UPI002C6546B5|nr:type II secretion system F family protein [Trinickia sp.]HVW50122.1 type II secretion system F family protein [Trinickia sp.]